MERRIGSQANFFNGALVGPCCVDGTAAEQEGYILRLQLNDRERGIAGERNTPRGVFSVTLNNSTTISATSERLSTPGGIKIGANGNVLPDSANVATKFSTLSSIDVTGPGSLKCDISPTVTVDAVTLISTDPNVGDAGALNLTNSSIKSVSLNGYYASGGVTVGPSVTAIATIGVTGGNFSIPDAYRVVSLTLVDTVLANPSAVSTGLQTAAAAGTLRFFSVDAATGMTPSQVTSISEAVTEIDAPGVAPTVTDVSNMSMVQLSYDGAVPTDFNLEYWLGATPDFTDVSAGTFIPGGEAPFTPLSQTNYYFKCRFVRPAGAPPPPSYLASELSPASGLYFMPKAPDYIKVSSTVTLSYTGANTPPGATVIYYIGDTASPTDLILLVSNVYTFSGPFALVRYFFCQLRLADGTSTTVISPAAGPVYYP
jgi:hypothetical protein